MTANEALQPTSLEELGRELLAEAESSGNGRGARSVFSGHEHALRQTLLALTAGSALADHESPGEATLIVLSGRVELTTPDAAGEAGAGEHLVIPPMRHGLRAIDDSVVLLTVVAR